MLGTVFTGLLTEWHFKAHSNPHYDSQKMYMKKNSKNYKRTNKTLNFIFTKHYFVIL
jgi:hypothetical protein